MNIHCRKHSRAAHSTKGMVGRMNRLRVKCVKCGKEWHKNSVIPWGPDDISSSLCDPCFGEVISPIIHKRQLSEGNLACFGKASTHCAQEECRYRQWCMRMEDTRRVEISAEIKPAERHQGRKRAAR